MVKKFREHIETQFPFLLGSKLLVACSGGLDSTVLAHLGHSLSLDMALAHCNFNLRGKESEGDEVFTKKLAGQLGSPYHSKSFDMDAEIKKRSGSVQMVARDLRYEWFQELAESQGFGYILVAHHADDALETFLIHLSRGTGIDGLTGIPAKNRNIVRPLLPFSRHEIFEYAKNHEITWREDSSNDEDKYLRNKIRHHIVPGLKALSPQFMQNFENTQKRLAGSAAILDRTRAELQSKLFERKEDQIRISVKALKELSPLQEYLYLLFAEFGFTQWRDINGLITAMSGKKVTSKTHVLLKDRDFLLLYQIGEAAMKIYTFDEGQKKVQHPVNLKIETVKTMGEPDKKTLYADKEKLNYPLKLRKWQNGDYFYPLGMQGKKKLSKFFKDEKVDLAAKDAQWLLCSGDLIVWVLGRRADNRFKVTKQTKEIVKITWCD